MIFLLKLSFIEVLRELLSHFQGYQDAMRVVFIFFLTISSCLPPMPAAERI